MSSFPDDKANVLAVLKELENDLPDIIGESRKRAKVIRIMAYILFILGVITSTLVFIFAILQQDPGLIIAGIIGNVSFFGLLLKFPMDFLEDMRREEFFSSTMIYIWRMGILAVDNPKSLNRITREIFVQLQSWGTSKEEDETN